VTIPIHPKLPERGTRTVSISNIVYIDRNDVRVVDANKYFGLAPGKQVILKGAFHITCTKVLTDSNGIISSVEAIANFDCVAKVKGVLHWVSGPDVADVTVNVYNRLFKSEDPSSIDDWISDLNPESLVVMQGKADQSIATVVPYQRFQFERVGYFVVDKSSCENHVVFNRICELKESREKKSTIQIAHIHK
jgi:glutaminyl-tRNA synthetase